jgi:uncharacterized protein (TIGR04255 family)
MYLKCAEDHAMTTARFTTPPVREVSLTVLWEPLVGLLAADVGDLLGRLRNEYPKVRELPAMAPWTERHIPGIQILAGDELPPYSWWMGDAENNRLVRFQFDRLIFSWRHTPDGDPYPEYPTMRQELSSLLARVNDWLTDKSQSVTLADQIKRVQIDYINQVDMTPMDLVCGVTTDWTGERRGALQTQSPNVTATWFIELDEPESSETAVRVKSDGLDGSILKIVSTSAKGATEEFSNCLDRVHKRSYDVFLSITSDELQRKWGRKT